MKFYEHMPSKYLHPDLRTINSNWRLLIQKFKRENPEFDSRSGILYFVEEKTKKFPVSVRYLLTDIRGDMTDQNKYVFLQSYYLPYSNSPFSTIDLVRLPEAEHRDIVIKYLTKILDIGVHFDHVIHGMVGLGQKYLNAYVKRHFKKAIKEVKKMSGIDLTHELIDISQRIDSFKLYRAGFFDFVDREKWNYFIDHHESLHSNYNSLLSSMTFLPPRFVIGGGFIQYNPDSNSITLEGSSGTYTDLIGVYDVNKISSYLISKSKALNLNVFISEDDVNYAEDYIRNCILFMQTHPTPITFYNDLIEFYQKKNYLQALRFLDSKSIIMMMINDKISIELAKIGSFSSIEAYLNVISQTMVEFLSEPHLVNSYEQRLSG